MGHDYYVVTGKFKPLSLNVRRSNNFDINEMVRLDSFFKKEKVVIDEKV
tara:strand:+ start:458 stop:604 length:147 start_codon:yes stop_codon:yes gene_type:complete